MWIICSGMARAGSTWQYLVATHLVEKFLGGRGCGFEGLELLVEAEAKCKDGKPRCFKTHRAAPFLSTMLEEGQAVALYSYRDLRDVAFSLMHIWNAPFEELVRRDPLTQLINADRFWKRQPRTLVQRFEAIMTDPATGVLEIANHLGVEIRPDEATGIASDFSKSRNFERNQAFTESLRERGIDLSAVPKTSLRDPSNQMHPGHIRSGDNNRWYDIANDEQLSFLLKICGEWLETNGYPLTAPSA